eukprot:754191-Hanusia_phi.AAC.9
MEGMLLANMKKFFQLHREKDPQAIGGELMNFAKVRRCWQGVAVTKGAEEGTAGQLEPGGGEDNVFGKARRGEE